MIAPLDHACNIMPWLTKKMQQHETTGGEIPSLSISPVRLRKGGLVRSEIRRQWLRPFEIESHSIVTIQSILRRCDPLFGWIVAKFVPPSRWELWAVNPMRTSHRYVSTNHWKEEAFQDDPH